MFPRAVARVLAFIAVLVAGSGCGSTLAVRAGCAQAAKCGQLGGGITEDGGNPLRLSLGTAVAQRGERLDVAPGEAEGRMYSMKRQRQEKAGRPSR